MFALAHVALLRLADRDVPASTVVRALGRFDATCVALTQGQHADMGFEKSNSVSVEAYIDMIRGKTAALLALCAELGALVAVVNDVTVNDYAQFGLNLGLAFQVIDDILGIWGDEQVTGKSVATDISTKKKTLPVLFGLSKDAALVRLYESAGALGAMETSPESPDQAFITQVVDLLNACGARQDAEKRAAAYSHAALAHLESASPQGPSGVALLELANMLLQRNS
jgi:geranylgeranyl diphosphate synthase type I